MLVVEDGAGIHSSDVLLRLLDRVMRSVSSNWGYGRVCLEAFDMVGVNEWGSECDIVGGSKDVVDGGCNKAGGVREDR